MSTRSGELLDAPRQWVHPHAAPYFGGGGGGGAGSGGGGGAGVVVPGASVGVLPPLSVGVPPPLPAVGTPVPEVPPRPMRGPTCCAISANLLIAAFTKPLASLDALANDWFLYTITVSPSFRVTDEWKTT